VDAGTIVLSGTNTLQQGATLELAAGAWNGTNVFAGPGTLVWSGGTISGRLRFQSNTAFSITGAGNKTFLQAFINSGGPATWTGSGAIYADYDSVFTTAAPSRSRTTRYLMTTAAAAACLCRCSSTMARSARLLRPARRSSALTDMVV
jgi:hypothetical protein